MAIGASPVSAATLPAGFQDVVAFSGVTGATGVRFSSDGRVFVAQKDGIIRVFDSLTDTTPATVLDLRSEVHNYWDRGLLGLALDPNFPATPYIYVLEAYDAPIGGTAPQWNDNCPDAAWPDHRRLPGQRPPARLTLSGNTVTAPKVLIKDSGASSTRATRSATSTSAPTAPCTSAAATARASTSPTTARAAAAGSPTPKNPCGDPPAGVGGTMTPPTAEGGALRAQSFRRPSGQPVLLNGAVLRVDPATGDALPDNPLAASSRRERAADRRLRASQPVPLHDPADDQRAVDRRRRLGRPGRRSTVSRPRPRRCSTSAGPATRATRRSRDTRAPGSNLCSSLYSAGTRDAAVLHVQPQRARRRRRQLPDRSSSITGLAFYTGASNYPASYNGGLFFADYARNASGSCRRDRTGFPTRRACSRSSTGALGPVDLEIGPNGDLFYADLNNGMIREIKYAGGGNQPPVAAATATPTSGNAPLDVNFDGSGVVRSRRGGHDLVFVGSERGRDVRRLDGCEAVVTPTSTAGTYNAVLKVTDNHGASTTSSPITITVPSGGSSTFGTTTPGTLMDTASSDLKEVSKFTAPQAGNVFKLRAMCRGWGRGRGRSRCGR